jgi:hypothetical protein
VSRLDKKKAVGVSPNGRGMLTKFGARPWGLPLTDLTAPFSQILFGLVGDSPLEGYHILEGPREQGVLANERPKPGFGPISGGASS